MPREPATPTAAVVDGRRARRERGRRAVTDAMIDLVIEGQIPPSSEQIAARAGVSVASLFRYFDTLDDLRRATTNLYFERYDHLFEIPDIGSGSRPARIERFVATQLALYEVVEPMARLARSRATEVDGVDATLHRVRATRADQIRHHFDDELGQLSRVTAESLVMVIATLTSFESWDQARHDHRRTQTQIKRAWTSALERLLHA